MPSNVRNFPVPRKEDSEEQRQSRVDTAPTRREAIPPPGSRSDGMRPRPHDQQPVRPDIAVLTLPRAQRSGLPPLFRALLIGAMMLLEVSDGKVDFTPSSNVRR